MQIQKERTKKRHHIVPNPQTKRRATFLTHNFLALYIIVLFSVLNVFNQAPKFAPGVLSYASNININVLLEETNKIRAQKGLKALVTNKKLSDAAYQKAQHMFKNNYWAHIAPNGTEPWYFILNQQYDYSYAGENLAKNFNNSRDVVEAWYKSPSHRENLLNSNYDDVGFAVVNGVLEGYETTLVVQMFGRSRYPEYLATDVQGVDTTVPAQVQEPVLNDIAAQVPSPEPVQGDKDLQVLPPSNQFESEELAPAKPIFSTNNVVSFNHMVSLLFGLFLVGMLSLDIWYSRKHVIFKPTGHTLAHIIFLTILVLSILFLIRPGIVL